MLWAIGMGILCYLLGAIPFPVLVSRVAKGIDLREHGSGNMGAANAGRVLGKKWFFVTFLLDFIKGASATYLFQWVLINQAGWDPVFAASVGATAAVFGHIFPIYVGFKGGMGLAATAGALALVSWPLMISALACAGLFWLLFRDMYIGVATTCLLYPLLGWLWLHNGPATVVMAVWGLVVFYTHRHDINRYFFKRKGA